MSTIAGLARAVEDSQKALEQVRRFALIDVLRDVAGSRDIVEGMEQARKFLENDSPFGIRAAALEAKRIVESPGFRAATVAIEKIESGGLAAPLEPTALPTPPPAVEPHVGKAPPEAESDKYELRLMLDLALVENDDLRQKNAALRREIRVWELSAVLGYATMPYPDLDAEDFEEKQP